VTSGALARTLLLAALAGGCCTLPRLAALPRVTGAPASPARLLEVLSRLRAAQVSVRTLKVVHHITLTSRGGASSGALRGLLAVRRPDAYRLRVFGPAGLTAMDLVWSSGRFVLDVPPSDVHLVGDERTPRRSLHGVPVDGLARAFLGTYEADRASLVEDRRWALLTLEEPGGARRILYVRPADGEVVIDSRFVDGREALRLTHADRRVVSGVALSHRVRCDMPLEGLSATIEVERYDVNPPLPGAAFALP
jgi:hypothetical protein